MRTTGTSLLSMGIIFMFVCLAVTIFNLIQSAGIDSWLTRAKDAGNPQQVAEFLTEYRDALYEADRVEGQYSDVFRYPGSYMPTYIRAIDGLIQRANDLAAQDSTDTSYQMGLVNLEKDLGDIESAAGAVWVSMTGFWYILGGITSLIVAAVGLLMAAE